MAGEICCFDDRIFRIGQIDSQNYGDGVAVFEILKLNNKIYEEKFFKEIKFENHFGPHTLNVTKEKVLYDYYTEQFDLSAIYKKIRNIL